MRCADFKKLLASKLIDARKFPNDEMLGAMSYEAMLWVANKCTPTELLRKVDINDKVYRHLDDDFFICLPDMPNFNDENEHLMIDESLTYAVMNEVAFMHTKEPIYRQMALDIVADYVANFKKGARW